MISQQNLKLGLALEEWVPELGSQKPSDESLSKFFNVKRGEDKLLAIKFEKLEIKYKVREVCEIESCEKFTAETQELYDQYTAKIIDWARYFGVWDGFSKFPPEYSNPFEVDTTIPVIDQPYQVSIVN